MSVKNFVYKTIIICLIGVMCVSAYNIFGTCIKYQKARSEYNELRKIASVDTTEIDWESLHKINQDIVAWICLKDSNINYPVVKGSDNDFYLHRTVKKDNDLAGTPFIDCSVKEEFKDFDTIIYGHNMRDGSMFNNLNKYIEKDGFYETHRQIELITPENKYHLVVFAGFYTKAGSDIYNSEYIREHINEVKGNNEIANVEDIEVTASDKIVTLSTCAYVYKNARCVIIGKLEPWKNE